MVKIFFPSSSECRKKKFYISNSKFSPLLLPLNFWGFIFSSSDLFQLFRCSELSPPHHLPRICQEYFKRSERSQEGVDEAKVGEIFFSLQNFIFILILFPYQLTPWICTLKALTQYSNLSHPLEYPEYEKKAFSSFICTFFHPYHHHLFKLYVWLFNIFTLSSILSPTDLPLKLFPILIIIIFMSHIIFFLVSFTFNHHPHQ